jgi:uncharacterized membrane protein
MHPAFTSQIGSKLGDWAAMRWVAQPQVQAAPVRGALFLGCFLASLQALDGIFTSIGINRYGLAIEGNPLLRTVMEQFGHIPTLAILKFLAILIVVFLTIVSFRRRWVMRAMGAVSFIYLFMAILPWAYILFVNSDI